jgi:uncharacterized repeat protein (TIGR03803 family)
MKYVTVGKPSYWKRAHRVLLFCTAIVIASPAQTFTTLINFDGSNGAAPYLMSITQGTDGRFYGTTGNGGNLTCNPPLGCGTVFKITSSGALTTLHTFTIFDGAYPFSGLVQANDGNFYGTTLSGGPNAGGTIFKITSAGTLTTLYSFCAQTNCTDGTSARGALVQATDGNLYGITTAGGAEGSGTVFKITSGGTLTTLYSFCAQTNCTDGGAPWAGLVQATDGNFYGTTEGGGNNGPDGYGTVFKMTPRGTLTTLHRFDSTEGAYPYAGLVQASNGNFYGTTYAGGKNNYGTVFKITSAGTLTTLYSFCAQSNCSDGDVPYAGLVQATDKNFYGTTEGGGADGYGTVFQITAAGTLTTLHSFDSTDGASPYGGLVQATSGKFYGAADIGGADDLGTIFSVAVGLGPFVETSPKSGKVGAAVKILGTNLIGATNVSFNGTSATFRIVSKSEIMTTVPIDATTGKVQVKTPSHTLLSNVPFRVKP